ncbi:MAG: response regulator transcription factor [Sphingobacteriales bacterium]|nr:response regulator transcription factor [Sphingobacteriales bacterium]
MTKILIIEDEPATSRYLKALLENLKDNLTVTAIKDSVESAVKFLSQKNLEVDLIFSDIRLSDGLTFEIFQKIELDIPIIFLTAYDEYALNAFKANGIDYLLKPFDEDDIHSAISKYRKLIGVEKRREVNYEEILKGLVSKNQAYRQSFLIHFRDKLIPITIQQIAWFYTAYEVVYAKTMDHKDYVIDYTLEQLEAELNPEIFYRANRQFLISRSSIKEMELYFNGRLSLKLQPETEHQVLISKAKVSDFKKWLGQ